MLTRTERHEQHGMYHEKKGTHMPLLRYTIYVYFEGRDAAQPSIHMKRWTSTIDKTPNRGKIET